eukprot:TRINITY_DN6763_c0_g1_i1.p1 TRINITY_DN6763_c0_g1~~TRINITY_DN6763_c0_g1_i1.p1  ORF type:complete len:242 (-),score=23.28 TRINITY_DN6763_c0_g1_i1:438-1163(-)
MHRVVLLVVLVSLWAESSLGRGSRTLNGLPFQNDLRLAGRSFDYIPFMNSGETEMVDQIRSAIESHLPEFVGYDSNPIIQHFNEVSDLTDYAIENSRIFQTENSLDFSFPFECVEICTVDDYAKARKQEITAGRIMGLDLQSDPSSSGAGNCVSNYAEFYGHGRDIAEVLDSLIGSGESQNKPFLPQSIPEDDLPGEIFYGIGVQFGQMGDYWVTVIRVPVLNQPACTCAQRHCVPTYTQT